MINWTQLKTAEDKARHQKQEAVETAERNRQAAYTQEADPLFFKWQAGEGTKEEWEAKREEIRARYPYPEDEA